MFFVNKDSVNISLSTNQQQTLDVIPVDRRLLEGESQESLEGGESNEGGEESEGGEGGEGGEEEGEEEEEYYESYTEETSI